MANETPSIPNVALPPGADAKYVEQMLARVDQVDPNVVESVEEKERADAVQLPSDKKPEAEALIAGKYKTQEDLVKGYEELQREYTKLRQQQQQPQPKKEEVAPPKKEEQAQPEKKDGLEIDPTVKAAQDAVQQAGLNFDEMSAEYATKGELSEDTMKKLEKGGIPRHLVTSFIDGQMALRDAQRGEVFNIAGGEDGYKTMVEWARDNMSADEIATYNRIVNGRDMGATKLAVAGLKARYEAGGNVEPNLIGGDPGNHQAGYESAEQMKADMRDPRYQKDPAFRAKVAAKLAVTPDALIR